MERLITERGADAMTRRSALLALSATMLSPGLMGQQTRPKIATRRLNNVMLAGSARRCRPISHRRWCPFLCVDGGEKRREARLPLLRHDRCGFRCRENDA